MHNPASGGHVAEIVRAARDRVPNELQNFLLELEGGCPQPMVQAHEQGEGAFSHVLFKRAHGLIEDHKGIGKRQVVVAQ